MIEFILLGGQYAEKGLILNLPVDISTILKQANSMNTQDVAVVHFEYASSSSKSLRNLVALKKLYDAFQWLQQFNSLYSNIENVPDHMINNHFHQAMTQSNNIEHNAVLSDLQEVDFKSSLYDLLSMFKTIGPPTLFVTLSADDLGWPELGMLLKNISYEEVYTNQGNFQHLHHDPVLSATHFYRRYKALYKHVINGPQKPLGGPISDFFIHVEFQNRGSPHFHIFYWVDRKLDTQQEILLYIDDVISSNMPSKDEDPVFFALVKRLQTHHCSLNYCKKTSATCRLGFPFQLSQTIKLLSRCNMFNKKYIGKM